MRITIQFRSPAGRAILPVHYNYAVQSFIYAHIEASLATRLHNEGWKDEKRQLKLFTFSRLRGHFRRAGQRLHFTGPIELGVASPVDALLESLAVHLMRVKSVVIASTPLEIAAIEVLVPPPYRRPVLLKALSPITVYSTFETPNGRKKTYYYAPQEPEFSRQVLENLRRKIRAWTGEDIPPNGATFRPVKVSNRNLVVARYKGTVIKGWTGIYELDAPEPYFRIALDAGLGAKNSQGFGFVEVWERKRKTSHRDTEDTGK